MTSSLLTFAYWCVLVAAVLPYVCVWLAKAGVYGPRENQQPRSWNTKLSGWRARADAAQANSFEGLPFFIGAVIIAHQLGAAQGRLDLLAGAYIALRVAYIAIYIAGYGSLRSLVWAAGLLVNISILFIGR